MGISHRYVVFLSIIIILKIFYTFIIDLHYYVEILKNRRVFILISRKTYDQVGA